MLRVRPVLGRTFHREENQPGEERRGRARSRAVAAGVRRRSGRDRPDHPARWDLHTVIGVMAPGFDYPSGRALWLPLRYSRQLLLGNQHGGAKGQRLRGRGRPPPFRVSAWRRLEPSSRRSAAAERPLPRDERWSQFHGEAAPRGARRQRPDAAPAALWSRRVRAPDCRRERGRPASRPGDDSAGRSPYAAHSGPAGVASSGSS